jgi:hypothetical protein
MDTERNTINRKNSLNKAQIQNVLLSVNRTQLNKDYAFDDVVRAWVNNKMAILLMRMQYVKTCDPEAMRKTAFFLEEIEHHFISTDAPKLTRNAFRYLKRYLSVYPYVTKKHCERAFQMIVRIYQAIGYKFNYVPSFTGFWDKTKKTVRHTAKEIFKPEHIATSKI